ncbi:MAG: Na(+)/H(+) antiporter subunit D [Deltaproteobacteria bacterium]|nr:MAG: Na(+)/H(+) antiporter subunit D [Deltaproteobacteria bacterium]HEX15611.1 Na(+)/H(+) antiporter subunit D [Deltaproteobacteria bacterium]
MEAGEVFIHPGFLYLFGCLLIPLLGRRLKKVYLLAIPLASILVVAGLKEGVYWRTHWLGIEIVLGRVDKLSLCFAWVFTIMALLGVLYGLHRPEDGHHMAAYCYVGSSLGAVFAGDYLSLFLFWELMAVSSVFLVWYRRVPQSIRAGFRYLLVHVFGGLSLFMGMMMRYWATGSLAFGPIPEGAAGLAEYLILGGFALNAAVIPLHAWLPDAYPEATVEGAVFMSAYTTKTAVYVLARGFAGYEVLAVLGTLMTVYGVFYAVIENDMRRVLAYHIISQVGYMVAGVGIGTAMTLNGACAHAFAHIIYKGLLFMGAGAVLYVVGTSKLSELGGLWRFMPWTMLFYIVGAVSISGFPLFSGFVSKTMTVTGAHEAGRPVLMALMELAAIGTFLSVGLKVTYFAFFGKESGKVAKEPPWNMLLAMFLASLACFLIGVHPKLLYQLLPFEVHYHPYAAHHVVETLELLSFTGLVFFLLVKKLEPEPKVNLDMDVSYRMGAKYFMWFDQKVIAVLDALWGELWKVMGLKALFGGAWASSSFDQVGIDGVVDGTAYGLRGIGGYVRRLQLGSLQLYIALSVAMALMVLALAVLE